MREVDTQVEVAASNQGRSTIAFAFMIARAMLWGFFIGVLINSYLWIKDGYAQFAHNAQATYQQQMDNIALRNQQVVRAYHHITDLTRKVWCLRPGVGNFESNSQSYWSKNSSQMDQDSALCSQESNEMVSSKASARGDVWLENKWQHSLHTTRQLSWRVPWLSKLDQYVDVSYYLDNSQVFWHRLVSMLVLTAKVVIAKCISLFASVWVFIFAALIGALDGLVARYIRTSEGGRESTFIFHKVADGLLKIPVILLFLYLTSPFFINPEWVVVLMGVLFFAFFYTATANLKKFL